MSQPEPGSQTEAAGFVLAGGRSSRMGRDKALLDLGGRPLIRHALDLLAAAGLPAVIAGARLDLTHFAPVLDDSGECPLAGICAALASTPAQLAVFVPVDMPLLPVALLRVLLRRARMANAPVTVPSVNGFAETFPVVIHGSTLPTLERELVSGRRGCFSAFEAASSGAGHSLAILPVEPLVEAGQVAHPCGLPASLWFLNANTPAEFNEIESLLDRSHRVI